MSDYFSSDITVEPGASPLPVTGPLTNTQLRATAVPVSGTVAVSNPGLTDTQLRASAVPITDANIGKSFGTWAYYAGVSGTVTVSGGQRVIGISCHATSAGSFTINGGAAIPIPAGLSINIQPLGNVTAPTIIFTGTDSYFVEVVS